MITIETSRLRITSVIPDGNFVGLSWVRLACDFAVAANGSFDLPRCNIPETFYAANRRSVHEFAKVTVCASCR